MNSEIICLVYVTCNVLHGRKTTQRIKSEAVGWLTIGRVPAV